MPGADLRGKPISGPVPGRRQPPTSAAATTSSSRTSRPGYQTGWRWCHKCQGLTFAGNATPGKCRGGRQPRPHRERFVRCADLQRDTALPEQEDWRWCKKCQGLGLPGQGDPGPGPPGGQHGPPAAATTCGRMTFPRRAASELAPAAPRAQGLAFAATVGRAPALGGGVHNHAGSANYVIAARAILCRRNPCEVTWRTKCHGVAFAGRSAAVSLPPAGGHLDDAAVATTCCGGSNVRRHRGQRPSAGRPGQACWLAGCVRAPVLARAQLLRRFLVRYRVRWRLGLAGRGLTPAVGDG